MSYKGRFRPKNHKKYKGDPTKVLNRSLWERRFMHNCENIPPIVEWNIKESVIRNVYPSDKKVNI